MQLEDRLGIVSENAKLLHRRLAVFEDSFSSEAAVEVCAFAPLDDAAVLRAIAELQRRRILGRPHPEGESCLCVIKPPSQSMGDEEPELRRRHMVWHAEVLDAIRPNLYSESQNEWFDRLDRSRPNIRAALIEASKPVHDKSLLIRMVGVLARFWFVRAYIDEGIEWTQLALDRDPEPDTIMGLRVWNSAALLLDMKGEHDRAIAVQQGVIGHARRLGHHDAEASGCVNLATFLRNADRIIEAYEVMQEAVPKMRQVGDPNKLASMLINLAAMSLDLSRPEAALTPLREAGDLAEQLGDAWLMGHVAYNYGVAYRKLGSLDKAQSRLEDALWIYYRLRDTRNFGDTLKQLAEMAGGMGDFDRSAVLVGAAELAREVSGSAAPTYDLKSELITVVRARLVLGDAEFDRRWQSGHEMQVEEVIRFAVAK